MINIVFSGDFAPIMDRGTIVGNHFSEIKDILFSADIHLTNLECPLTGNNFAIEKSGPAIKADIEAIEVLKQANVGIACLANNHIFDFGEQGLKDTLEICQANNIDTIGIVSRPDGRSHWLIKEIEGRKIGFINYCEHEFSVREKGFTGACGYDPTTAFYEIKSLRTEVDFLIVIYHGGNEYYYLPNPDLRTDFRYLADLGADAVIGHHSHVYSGYEIYNGKPLVYSLGNFFFPYPGEPPEWNNGVIFQLSLGGDIPEFRFIPVIQCYKNLRTTFQPEAEKNMIFENIKCFSEIIKDDYKLQIMWEKYVAEKGSALADFFMISNSIERKLSKMKIYKKLFLNKKRDLALVNILRCRSLRLMLEKKLLKQI